MADKLRMYLLVHVTWFAGVSAGLPRVLRNQLLPILLLHCNYEVCWHQIFLREGVKIENPVA